MKTLEELEQQNNEKIAENSLISAYLNSNISIEEIQEMLDSDDQCFDAVTILIAKFLIAARNAQLEKESFIFYQDFIEFCKANKINLPNFPYLTAWKNMSTNFINIINEAKSAIKELHFNFIFGYEKELQVIFSAISPSVKDVYFDSWLINYLNYHNKNDLINSLDFIPSSVANIHYTVTPTCKRKVSPRILKEHLMLDIKLINLAKLGVTDIETDKWNYVTPNFSKNLSTLYSSSTKQKSPTVSHSVHETNADASVTPHF